MLHVHLLASIRKLAVSHFGIICFSPLQDLVWGRDMHRPTFLLWYNFIKVCFDFSLLFRVLSFKWAMLQITYEIDFRWIFLRVRSCECKLLPNCRVPIEELMHACIQCLNLTSSAYYYKFYTCGYRGLLPRISWNKYFQISDCKFWRSH